MSHMEGILQNWNDEKGYGFIVVEGDRTRFFAHIYAFRCKYPRPCDGDKCSFSVASDDEGRPRAANILRPGLEKKCPAYSIPILAAAAYAIWIGLLRHQGLVPDELPPVLIALSLISFGLYGLDKRRAKRHAFRISEARLHFVDLLGGWPGGWFAQIYFQHKIRKSSFYSMFYVGIVVHMFFLAYLTTESGQTYAANYFGFMKSVWMQFQNIIQRQV